MDDVVRTTFSDAVARMSDELGSMPLSRWNESVFRYFFCRRLAASYPDVTQFVECDHVDLVLHGPTEKAFIEFKFYLRQQKFDPYSGSSLGFKGGPGPKNLGEFRKCIDQLYGRRPVPGLSKYVALVYADRAGTPLGNQYSGPLRRLPSFGRDDHSRSTGVRLVRFR